MGLLRFRQAVSSLKNTIMNMAVDLIRKVPPSYRNVKVLLELLVFITLIVVLVWRMIPKTVKLEVTGTVPSILRVEENALPDPVHIYFNGSAAQLQDIGKHVSRGISIQPIHPGKWVWDNDRQLTFTTSRPWPVGTNFTVKFEKSLFPKHIRLRDYRYVFTTPKFNVSITKAEFYLDPKNPKLKKIVATVSFSHPVDTAEFEKRVKIYKEIAGGLFGLKQDLRGFTVSYNKYFTEAYIHSENLPVPSEESELILEIGKGFGSTCGGRPFDDELKNRIVVPGVFSIFQIRDAQLTLVRNQLYEPEQVLILNTSNGVLSSEFQKNLEVYELPVDLPAFQGRQAVKNFNWGDPSIVGPEILALSTKVVLEPIPTELEYSTLHSFKHTVPVGRYILVRIKKGTISYGDYVLANEFNTIIRVPPFPQELNIMHDGAILSLSGEKKLSILSRGIDGLRFQVARILPGQINHLVSQSEGKFKSPEFKNWNFNYQNIAEKYIEERMLEVRGPAKTQYSSFDMAPYLSKREGMGLFFLKVESWDPVSKRVTGMQDSRLVLVTDLGLVVKDCKDGSHEVFVQSIHSGEPAAGVTVEILGKNGISTFSRTTDENGHVTFPSLLGYSEEKSPTVYIARRGNDVSFIPFDWGDRRLDMSRFDIGGVETPVSGNLSAFLFSDRGIYRPGEKITVASIVKSGDWRQDLTGIPLEITFTDPRGIEISKKRIKLASGGFDEFSYQTEETQPIGNYTASIYTVKDERRWNMLGSLPVRVEEFLPDRLRIMARFSSMLENGWVSPDNLKGKVSLYNLYGLPAAGNKLSASIVLSPAFPVFKGFDDYRFFDPAQAKREFSEALEEKTTNGNGEAEFDLNLERFEKATFRLVFSVDGFEAESGRGVSANCSTLVSPRPYLIGWKADGNLDYINKNSQRDVRIIAVDPALKKITVEKLKADILEQRYVSTLVLQKDGTYRYQSVLKETPVSSKIITIAPQGFTYVIPTDNPGDFVLSVKDEQDTELNRIAFTVAGAANLIRNLDRNAELQIKLDKSDYDPGDEIQLQIAAPYTGSGLITIERDKVYSYKWFKTSKTNTIQTIRVPGGLEGNAYVSVEFIRSMSSPEIYMSPLSYGAASFSISRKSRTNIITLNANDRVFPGKPLHIRYKAERPGRVVIYAVDEGILQVAGYQLPDPLSFFFQKRSLEVQTLQIMDLILPEYSMIQSVSSPGGDEGFAAIGKNLNPFKRKREKAVTFWSGIKDIGTEEREVVYNVPDYFNGTLRIMAVAVSQEAIGAVQKKTEVRGSFVINPNVPPILAPGDEADIGVSVANSVEGSGKKAEITVRLNISDNLEMIGMCEQKLVIPEGAEGRTSFRVKVKNVLGTGKLVFKASYGEKSSQRALEASIRPVVNYATTLQSGFLASGTKTLPVPRKMYSNFRVLEITASPLPLALCTGLMHYLQGYPYDGTEVIISQAFSVMELARIPGSGYTREDAMEKLAQVTRLLQARQNMEGALGFWAANSYASDRDTVFGAHLLIDARDGGYPVPDQLHAKLLACLRNMAGSSVVNSMQDARTKAYAIYVLTRNGIITTNYLNNLREQMDAKFGGEWKKDLAGVYVAASYQLLQLGDQAFGLIKSIRFGDSPRQQVSPADDLERDAMLLYILSEHFPEKTKNVKGSDLSSLVDLVATGRYTTMSSAYAILGFTSYAKVVGDITPGELSFTEYGPDGKKTPLQFEGKLFARAHFSGAASKVSVKNSMGHGIFYQITQAGFDLVVPSEEHHSLEVQREYRKGNDVVSQVKIGDEVEVHLKMRTIENGGSQNVVIVDLFPAGFELVEDSIKTRPVRAGTAAAEEQRGEDDYVSEGEGMPSAGYERCSVQGREDRLILSMDVGASAEEFIYKLKATNKGRFTIPPVYAEASCDRSIMSSGKGGTIVIK